MKKLKHWFLDTFVYAGLPKEHYQDIRRVLQEKNLTYLRMSAAMSSLVFLLLLLAAFRSDALAQRSPLYIVMLAVSAVTLLLTCVVKKQRPLIVPLYYCFLLAIYVFSILLGTVYNPDVPVTTFCVLLFAMPLLIIDSPYRISILLILSTGVFCAFSHALKPPAIATLDRINGITFLFLSIVVNAITTRIRMREPLQRKYIERERDTDDLTKLMTKAATQREISDYIDQCQDTAMLLIIDIDDFKHVNDTFGHAYGDAVLRLMGDCIREVFRPTDIMGRFGGDEFVIFLPHMRDRTVVANRVELLVSLMRQRIAAPETATRLSGSIGIAVYPENGGSYQELFERADQALYESKRQGKDRYTFYFDADLAAH